LGFGKGEGEVEMRTSLLAAWAEVPVVVVTGGPEVSLLHPICSMRRFLFFISLASIRRIGASVVVNLSHGPAEA
jgi:hypothetical protein